MKKTNKKRQSLSQFSIIIFAIIFLIIISLINSDYDNSIRTGAQELPDGGVVEGLAPISDLIPEEVLPPSQEPLILEESAKGSNVNDVLPDEAIIEPTPSEPEISVTSPEPVVGDEVLGSETSVAPSEPFIDENISTPTTQPSLSVLPPKSVKRSLKEIESEFHNQIQSGSLINNSYILGNEKYTLPGTADSWLGSDDYRWNAALNYANANNARVTGQLKVGLGTITIATDTIAYSSTTPRIVFGGGTNGTLTFRDAVSGSDLVGVNDLVKIIDNGTVADLSVSGKVIVGNRIEANATSSQGMSLSRYASSASLAPFISFRRLRPSFSLPTAVVSGDFLGKFDFQGYDGAANQQSALFFAIVDDTVSSGSVPTAFIISTGTNGTNSPERFRINSSGNVGVSTTTPSQRLTVDGKIKIGNDTATATAGTIRWSGTDFEGFDGTQWLSLTCQ